MSKIRGVMPLLFTRLKGYIKRYSLFFLCFFFLAVILKNFPYIDIVISNIFYDQVRGFYLSDTLAAMTVYNAVNYVTLAMIISYSSIIIADIILKKNLFGIRTKFIAFLLITLIIGPGIIVNAVLKENVGRPRPDAVIEFGGDDTFVGPFTISNACDSNCSFTSGHAALGFYFMAFGFAAVGTMRKRLISLGFLIGVIVSLTRIVQGRHFFSDTLFSFFFVWTVITSVYELMFGNEKQ